jgi:glycosyltransferase involved in cell wall biosynthesis
MEVLRARIERSLTGSGHVIERGSTTPGATPPSAALRIALFYDLDACHGPTGVTRHALAQLERLAQRPEFSLSVITGRMSHPDGRAYYESLGDQVRRELPASTRNILRWWRVKPWPPLDWWTGPVDWVYCPAEYFVATSRARVAVTSHDVLQTLKFEPARKRDLLRRVFARSDLILSVSHYNTQQLHGAFSIPADRVAYVPNGAEDLFFKPAPDHERSLIRADLGLPPQVPYLLSVANFQPRKNLLRLVQAATRIPEIASGELGLVLIGAGAPEEAVALRQAAAAAGRRALICMPGYRQGTALRAAYAEATALVFPSLCESFGIPAVEAMAQGTPVALADSTALPEIGGEAAWYFDPTHEESITATLRRLLDDGQERSRRIELGRSIAAGYNWQAANNRLAEALAARRPRS